MPSQVAVAHNKLTAMTQHPVSDEDDGDENSEARRNTIKGFAQKIVSMMMSRERESIVAEWKGKQVHHT